MFVAAVFSLLTGNGRSSYCSSIVLPGCMLATPASAGISIGLVCFNFFGSVAGAVGVRLVC